MNIGDILKDVNKVKSFLEKLIDDKKNKDLVEILIPIVKHSDLTYNYAKKIVKDKVKDEWEDIIVQDSLSSYNYAMTVLNGPFPKGEDVIATNPYTAYNYARNVLKGRFEKGEDAIAKSAIFSYYYAKDVLHDRFPKGEKAIISSKVKPSTSDLLEDDEFVLDAYIEFLKSIGKLNEFLRAHPEVKEWI